MPLIITTSYDGPDLDGYGCAVAYAELLRAQGKDAEAHMWGEPQLEVRWFLEAFHLTPAAGPISDPNVQVIFLDARSPRDLPSPLLPPQVIEVIDHHPLLEGDEVFPNAVTQIEDVGAAATLVAERFHHAHITPSKESALLLYAGILSNTFNYVSATDRDRAMASWLRDLSGAPDDLAQQLFTAKSDLSGPKLADVLLSDIKLFTIKGKRIGTTQLEIVDVQTLIQERRSEIEDVLSIIKREQECDYTFINMKDFGRSASFILCGDEQTFSLLQPAPGITWDGRLGESKILTLRKKIMAWIDERLKADYV